MEQNLAATEKRHVPLMGAGPADCACNLCRKERQVLATEVRVRVAEPLTDDQLWGV